MKRLRWAENCRNWSAEEWKNISWTEILRCSIAIGELMLLQDLKKWYKFIKLPVLPWQTICFQIFKLSRPRRNKFSCRLRTSEFVLNNEGFACQQNVFASLLQLVARRYFRSRSRAVDIFSSLTLNLLSFRGCSESKKVQLYRDTNAQLAASYIGNKTDSITKQKRKKKDRENLLWTCTRGTHVH